MHMVTSILEEHIHNPHFQCHDDLSSWAWLMDIFSHSLYLTSVAWDGDKWSNIVSQHQMHCNLNLKDEAQNLVWLKIYNNSFQD
jgi:hypothetical protein